MALSKDTEAAIRAYVAEVVAKAPPVTPERLERLARLIRPPRTPRPPHGRNGGGRPTPGGG